MGYNEIKVLDCTYIIVDLGFCISPVYICIEIQWRNPDRLVIIFNGAFIIGCVAFGVCPVIPGNGNIFIFFNNVGPEREIILPHACPCKGHYPKQKDIDCRN